MKQKHNLDSVTHLENCDELYNEKADGQILIRRSILNLKFEFLLFIDISNFFNDKRQKAIDMAELLNKLKHPNLLNLTADYILLDSDQEEKSILLFQ
jgi:hypothetical protein